MQIHSSDTNNRPRESTDTGIIFEERLKTPAM